MRAMTWTDTNKLQIFLLITGVHYKLPTLDLHDITTDLHRDQAMETEKRLEIIQRSW